MLHSDNIYTRAMNLCAATDAFYYQDFKYDDSDYRIFNYRLASYNDWLRDSVAFEMRGIMFQICEGEAVLACRPMQKFFNLHENSFTSNLDLSDENMAYFMDKMDGSLISTWFHIHPDMRFELRLKSKGSIASDQVKAAEAWLKQDKQASFFDALTKATFGCITVDMEWTAPDNRIVLNYAVPRLTVLGARKTETGEYLTPQELIELFDVENVVSSYVTPELPELLSSYEELRGIEGYVVVLKSGERFKIKTKQYLELHHAKDSISSPKKVAICILNESIDDIRSLFADDALLIANVAKLEQLVIDTHNNIVRDMAEYVKANIDLSRKDFAIKTRDAVSNDLFGLYMTGYLYQNRFEGSREPNVKEYIIKHFDELFTDLSWYQLTGVTNGA